MCDELIELLVRYGGHVDFRTVDRLGLAERYRMKYGRVWWSSRVGSLQCLCARRIVEAGVAFGEELGANLAKFVRRH